MICKEIKIWNENEFKSIDGFNPVMDTYILNDRNREIDKEPIGPRPAVLILPGGGYEFTSYREAEPIATQFNAMGFNAFVLYYCCKPHVFPQALKDVSRAMCIIRDNAKDWNIDPDKIFVSGFSAGGHLAASIGTMWDLPCLSEIEGMEYGKNKPNAMILAYPVIVYNEFANFGSYENLLGKDYPALAEEHSLEKHVSEKTPPAFIWHTYEDDMVPLENALSFGDALRKNNIPFEMHIFTKGGHGLSLANEEVCCDKDCDVHVQHWVKLLEEWLKMMF